MNWLFPYAEGGTTVTTAATPAPSEPDCPLFRWGGAEETNSGASPSASSSSSADAFSFSASGQRSPSTSTSALCFGAGGAGTRLWSSSKALARASNIHADEEGAQQAAASVAPKGFAVGRHLRWISRRLRKAGDRVAIKETPAVPRRGAVDDTARERAEAVASAVAHCKDTLRRGTPRRRRILPPLSSLSLDLWLRDWQDEIIATAAAHCNDDECGDARPPAAFFPTALARHAPCPCMRLPHIQGGHESAAAAAAATGTPSSSQISGPVASRQAETRGSFSELEFLETFDGNEELIDRDFITVQI